MNIKHIAISAGAMILLGALTACGWFGFQVYQQRQQALAEIHIGDAFYRSMNYELALQTYKHAKESWPKMDVEERIQQSEEALISIMERESREIMAELELPATAKAEQVPFDFEDVPNIENEFISYYYLRPLPTQIVPMLDRYLSEERIQPDSAIGEIVSHFWAMLLHQAPEKIERVKLLQPKFSDQASEFLQKIVTAAEHFQPTPITSPEHLHLAWAEFIASGKVAYIDKIFDVFRLEETPENKPLLTMATQYVLEKSPEYLEMRDRVLMPPNLTEIVQYEALEAISQQLQSAVFLPAQEHSQKGDDLYRQKNYEEALDEYKKFARLYPGHSRPYEGIAMAHKQLGDRGRALRFLKRALWINPYERLVYFNLGTVYTDMLDYESAIAMHKKALEISPRSSLFLYTLASAYKKNHDMDNAIVYFQEYLKYSSNRKRAEKTEEYLASLGVEPQKSAESVTISLLKKREYLRLEQHLQTLLTQKKRDDEGYRLLYLAYEELTKDDSLLLKFETRIQYLNEWVQRSPSSHFSNAVMGRFYVAYAGDARGSGYADTVTEQGAKLHKERLLLAKTYLEKAYSLDPDDPFVPSALISVVLGLGQGREDMERQFQRAIQADPDAYEAYSSKLIYLRPQWYGSEAEMFAFAREFARKGSSKSRSPLLPAMAHWSLQEISKHQYAYFKKPLVWEETKSAYDAFLSRYPHAMGTHNRFALAAYLAGDYSTAKQEFEIIGNNWYFGTWNDYRYFSRIKQEVTNQ